MIQRTIIIVNDYSYVNGGIGVVALSSAKALVEKGYRVILFSAVSPIDPSLLIAGVEVVCLEQNDILNNPYRMKAIWQGLWNKKAEQAFGQLLSTIDPENSVIHFHGWYKALSCSVLYVAGKMKFNTFITLHDFSLYCPNGGLYNYKNRLNCSLNPMGMRCLLCDCDSRSYLHKLWRYVRSWIQKEVISKNEKISFISISALTTNLFYKYYKNKNSCLYRVNNPISSGVDKERVSVENNKYYLFMARLSVEKGIDLFCEAITQLGLKGIVLGDGYLLDSYKERYPSIIFTGWVMGEEKENYIRSAKTFIFTSILFETFGLSVAEMLSYGIPCIVPDKCAAAELVRNGENGFLFESNNLLSLKEAIVRMENMNVYNLSVNAFSSFPYRNYSMETHCSALLHCYFQQEKH